MQRFCLLFCLIFVFGCGVGEQPLVPTEDEARLEVDAVGEAVPEGEILTSIVKVRYGDGVSRIPIVTQFGIPTQTFVIIDGELTERIVFFQDEPKEGYYHLIPISEIDGEHIEDVGTVLLNLLDQKIVPVEMRREAGGLVDFEHPLNWADEIEIVIKDRFKYIREYTYKTDHPVFGVQEKKKEIETEMIFAKVKRNLTRPHWNDAFQ